MIRHVETDPSKQDEDPVDLADCSTQRNLSAQGRADARAIGQAIRRLKINVATVLTSAFRRTRETARLIFWGRGSVSRALPNTINVRHDAAWRAQVRSMRALLGTKPKAGSVTALVTHGILVTEATGQTLEEGGTLVFRPLGSSRFRLVGRILPDEWGRCEHLLRPRQRGCRSTSSPPARTRTTSPRPGTDRYTAQPRASSGRLDPATGKSIRVPLGAGSAPHGVIVGPGRAAGVTDDGLNALVRVDHETLAVRTGGEADLVRLPRTALGERVECRPRRAVRPGNPTVA